MELNSGMQPKLLTDKNAQPNDVQLQYITDDKINNNSVKEIYFRWLSRLVVLCAILSLGLFLSASLVIFRLAPEIIVEPLLIISQNDSATMVRYEPITPICRRLGSIMSLWGRTLKMLTRCLMTTIPAKCG